MSRSSAGWYGIPAYAFQDLQQRTLFRLQELGEWTQGHYRNLVDPRLACSDPRYHHLYRKKSPLDLIRLSARGLRHRVLLRGGDGVRVADPAENRHSCAVHDADLVPESGGGLLPRALSGQLLGPV